MKWCAEFVFSENIKSRGKRFGRRKTQPCLIFVFWKMTNNFNQSATQWTFFACFLRTISGILGTDVERDTLMVSLVTNRDRWFVLWSSLRRTLPNTDEYLKKYNYFKCALRQSWKLFAQSTPKLGKVTVITYKFGITLALLLRILPATWSKISQDMTHTKTCCVVW